MGVDQLVWWWEQACLAMVREQGGDPEKKPEKQIETADRAALYKQYPELKKTGRVGR